MNSVRQTIDACGERMQHDYTASLMGMLRSEAERLAQSAGANEASILRGLEAMCQRVQLPAVKHVVVCIMVPATWLQVRSAYPSLFLNGWDFSYLDSLTEAQGCVSASHWMKVACGLQEGFPEACAGMLAALNKRALNSVVLGVTGIRSKRHFGGVKGPMEAAMRHHVAMETFYMSPQSGLATSADRLKALQALEGAMDGQTLCSLMADRFLALFTSADLIEQLNVSLGLVWKCVYVCCLMGLFVLYFAERCRVVFIWEVHSGADGRVEWHIVWVLRSICQGAVL